MKETRNTVTYICEAIGCENKKTMHKSGYNNSKSHYCSIECYNNTSRGKPKRKQVDVISVSQRIKEYFEG